MRVDVDIQEEDVDGDYGLVPGLRLTCQECGHWVLVCGTSDKSPRRGAILLREQCPDDNFYDVDYWL
ncbi:hypothetical protein ACFB49_00020 [Sphingomonas sp. DBB INV C78]|uniref:hypothetical protein n=1 Tax=Sphingomonas sp. DBB INV C78 TaxID=3349434 RepID=UPI0036D2A146